MPWQKQPKPTQKARLPAAWRGKILIFNKDLMGFYLSPPQEKLQLLISFCKKLTWELIVALKHEPKTQRTGNDSEFRSQSKWQPRFLSHPTYNALYSILPSQQLCQVYENGRWVWWQSGNLYLDLPTLKTIYITTQNCPFPLQTPKNLFLVIVSCMSCHVEPVLGKGINWCQQFPRI